MPAPDPHHPVPTWAWLVLAGVIGVSLVVDLATHRGDRGVGRRAAIAWSVAWIALALAFGGWVALEFGRTAGEDFVTAFLVEKSLSIDTLFVFLLIFERLHIPVSEQHRVLVWGILGALATRAVFIAAGIATLEAWHGVVYVLGAFLLYSGIKMLRERGAHRGDGRILPFLRRHLRLTPGLDGHRFFTTHGGRRVATPLFLALLVIETTDVIFALDSIPAVFAISSRPFIVYSSNVFAVLGLRALYLVLATLLAELRFLRHGLSAILVFAGGKMLTSGVLHVPHAVSLLVIVGVLATAITASVLANRYARRESRDAPRRLSGRRRSA